MSPQRIQRSRTKGWRMPVGAVYVGRPSRWGNPAQVGLWASVGDAWRDGDRCTMSTFLRTLDDCVAFYSVAMRYGGMVVGDEHGNGRRPVALPSVGTVRAELAGKALACWCPPTQRCHADVLLRIANEDAS